MSENLALLLRNDHDRSIAFLPQAEQIKAAALESAALIGKVDTAEENEVAFRAQAALAEVRKQVEKARVAAKEPVLDFGKRIDAAAKAFVADINAEEIRIAGLTGSYAQLQLAKQRAAEAAIRLEQERIERERQAEMRRVAEEQAAAQRKLDVEKAEAERKAREARNAKEREEAERARIELERKQALAVAANHEQFDKINEAASNAQAAVQVAAPLPIRAEGQTVKTDIEITVTDVWLLARAHPTCVKMEPRISEIKQLIHAGVKVAGVTYKEIVKSQVRTAAPVAAIDV